MNNLEDKIIEYLKLNDIDNMTAKDVADQFFVSRTYIYKVLRKMGYASYTELKYEKRNMRIPFLNTQFRKTFFENVEIDKLVKAISCAQIVYIIGFDIERIVCDYLMHQLINLKKVAICISDIQLLKKYSKVMAGSDICILVSNTGYHASNYEYLAELKLNIYVVTPHDSKLSKVSEHRVEFDSGKRMISNAYDTDDISQLFETIQLILSQFKIYISMKEEE